jgi:predicted glycogen debranching enzyme
MKLELDRETLRNLESSLSCEWLETNGLGGFASSTVIGLNTRRYHGLLTAATRPRLGHLVLLSKLEETLVIEGRRYELSCNEYPGVIHPRGFVFQTQFRLDPYPVFTYEVEDLRLEKSVLMVHGQNTTVVHYELYSDRTSQLPAEVLLDVRPLIAFRDYHNTSPDNGALNARVDTEDGITSLKPYADLPWLHLAHDVAECEQTGNWYRSFQYAIERERGLDFAEDLFNPCTLIFDLNRYSRARIIASTERRDIRSADSYRERETRRRQAISAHSPENELVKTLTAAADQYIVARGEQKTIIAGYHWFSDWGRDTMIALPGLTLATNRPEIARSILRESAQHMDQGMLPNRFPDAGEKPEYNTVDASLWFFEAVSSLLQYTDDYDFVHAQLYKVLQEIVACHIKGTRYNIRLDSDGLLFSGEPGMQLTWMDAKVGDWVVTPRIGKPVEIQALWYNALRIMQYLADRFGEPHRVQEYSQLAGQADTSFNEQFWNESQGCLYDVINGEERDSSIRPNQIIALSLTHSMVPKVKATQILKVIERELLTPRGLRTLSPVDPKYCPRYEGDPLSREGAYHQGTVWPWLMGPFIRAYTKTFGLSAGRSFGAAWLRGFENHLHEACLGQVSEIFDADSPHLPRGCVAQAWSVGELLRAAVEDVFETTPSRRNAASVSG